ncbi:ferredoxin [Actinomadura rupiterrae]|uniref:ferredoxin n=1 Tax=Actinomadura rupiterrae TaxID=559627 RepID=UPI0027E2FFC8|nr:ferredoxin [Actinomadura rupiterrae]MCP2341870.1 ferredoxin [Actinomadura rupiterrae]
MSEDMKIIADRDRCLGAGQCALYAPDVFDQSDEDGTVVLMTETPPAERHEAVRLAADMCPNAVLTLEEDGGRNPQRRAR